MIAAVVVLGVLSVVLVVVLIMRERDHDVTVLALTNRITHPHVYVPTPAERAAQTALAVEPDEFERVGGILLGDGRED